VIVKALTEPARLPSSEGMLRTNERPNPLFANYTREVLSKTCDGDKDPNTTM
jgi:hypothetical protein